MRSEEYVWKKMRDQERKGRERRKNQLSFSHKQHRSVESLYYSAQQLFIDHLFAMLLVLQQFI